MDFVKEANNCFMIEAGAVWDIAMCTFQKIDKLLYGTKLW